MRVFRTINILGSPTVEKTTTGFKGAMATFDATRPLVAASGVGVARAALEFLKEKLAENGVQIRYGLPRQKLTIHRARCDRHGDHAQVRLADGAQGGLDGGQQEAECARSLR